MTFNAAVQALRAAKVLTPFPDDPWPFKPTIRTSDLVEPMFKSTVGTKPIRLFLDYRYKPVIWATSFLMPWTRYPSAKDFSRVYPTLEFSPDYWLMTIDNDVTQWIRRQRYIRQTAIPE